MINSRYKYGLFNFHVAVLLSGSSVVAISHAVKVKIYGLNETYCRDMY
jgi:hypothetical protein